MTKQEATQKIREIADKYSHFKIGKTGQGLSDRFDSEYKEEYEKIIPICHASDSSIIDQWEKDLIAHFQKDGDYKGKCDNDAIGGGDMDESDTYRIYVVVK